jgi:hypothetical protein
MVDYLHPSLILTILDFIRIAILCPSFILGYPGLCPDRYPVSELRERKYADHNCGLILVTGEGIT